MITNTRFTLTKLAPYLAIIIISLLYFSSIMQVPFHPDESTQIFMSSDVETIFSNVRTLFWSPDLPPDRKMDYRLLDAPIPRNLIGLGRLLASQSALQMDWNWSFSWSENLSAGAFPTNLLLLTARLSVAWVFPISLLFLWSFLSKQYSKLTGWVGIIFFAFHSLILLHTRRAMAQSTTAFAIIFIIWAIYNWKKHPWLLAIPAGIAFCSKQSTIIWVIICLGIILWANKVYQTNIKQRIMHSILYAVLLITLIFLFNPFMWKHPVQSTRFAILQRQNLITQQLADIYDVSPDAALTTPLLRLSGVVGNLLFTQPASVDTTNYMDEMVDSIDAYTQNPINILFRGYTGGTFVLVFLLLGLYFLLRFPSTHHYREDILLICAGLLQFVLLVATIPLPFQRYVIPLVPTTCIFFAVGISRLMELLFQGNYLRSKN